jgi:hypothetical protein
MYRTVVTICTASLTFSNSTFCPHSVFICFVWIWEQTAIISLYNINWLVFVTEVKSVYCAVLSKDIYFKSPCDAISSDNTAMHHICANVHKILVERRKWVILQRIIATAHMERRNRYPSKCYAWKSDFQCVDWNRSEVRSVGLTGNCVVWCVSG